jgi:hypothetical protein
MHICQSSARKKRGATHGWGIDQFKPSRDISKSRKRRDETLFPLLVFESSLVCPVACEFKSHCLGQAPYMESLDICLVSNAIVGLTV